MSQSVAKLKMKRNKMINGINWFLYNDSIKNLKKMYKKQTHNHTKEELSKTTCIKRDLQEFAIILMFLKPSCHQCPHCSLELLVPQAVDEGVQGWRHH